MTLHLVCVCVCVCVFVLTFSSSFSPCFLSACLPLEEQDFLVWSGTTIAGMFDGLPGILLRKNNNGL